jgi:hypothetical protein
MHPSWQPVKAASVSVTAGMCQPPGVFRPFDDTKTCPPSDLLLGALQHPFAQDLKARPPSVFDVMETLLDLEALDPPFAETFGEAALIRT